MLSCFCLLIFYVIWAVNKETLTKVFAPPPKKNKQKKHSLNLNPSKIFDMFDFAKNGTVPEPVMRKILSRKFAQEVMNQLSKTFTISCLIAHYIIFHIFAFDPFCRNTSLKYVPCILIVFLIAFTFHVSRPCFHL